MLVKRGGGRGRGWRARRGKDQVALFVKGFKYLSVGHRNGSLLAFFLGWVGGWRVGGDEEGLLLGAFSIGWLEKQSFLHY